MPNVLVRVTRYILRSRKRSASLQSSSTASATGSQQTNSETTGPEPAVASPQQATNVRRNKRTERQVNNHNEPVRGEAAAAETKQKASQRSHNDNSSIATDSNHESNNYNYDCKNEKEKPSNVMAIKMSSTTPQSTTVRSRRVLRELQVMMKASEHEDCPFNVSLVDDDNIFEWDVRLLKVDESSDLWRSMLQTNTECIRFRLTFPELFPFQPPFLRLVGPYLDNGFIMEGGAICMEVLTAQGWSSAYTVESLLVQVTSGLTQGGAIISTKQKRKYNHLTQKRAEAEFRRICKIHAKYGWVNMEREEA